MSSRNVDLCHCSLLSLYDTRLALRCRPETVLSFGIGEDRVENCAAAVIDLCAVLDDRLGPEAREAAAVTCGKSARAGQS